MNIEFKIKNASIIDLCNHLTRASESFEPPLDSYVNIEEYSKKLYENAVTFEAWNGDLLIGLAAAYCNNLSERICFLTNLSVEKSFQGIGIANSLTKQVIDYAKTGCFNKIMLEAKKNNKKVINFYKSNNFRICGINADCFVMELDL